MERTFLDGLQKADEAGCYLVEGKVWRGMSMGSWDELYLPADEEGVRLAVRHKDGNAGGFCFEYGRDLAPKVRFLTARSAPTLVEACRAALAFSPESLSLEYLGQTLVCYADPRFNGTSIWQFAVDGERGEAFGPFARGEEMVYEWERDWAPGKGLLESFCNCPMLRGRAPSLQEAIIAAVDAPEFFKRACGQLVASLA